MKNEEKVNECEKWVTKRDSVRRSERIVDENSATITKVIKTGNQASLCTCVSVSHLSVWVNISYIAALTCDYFSLFAVRWLSPDGCLIYGLQYQHEKCTIKRLLHACKRMHWFWFWIIIVA